MRFLAPISKVGAFFIKFAKILLLMYNKIIKIYYQEGFPCLPAKK